LLALGLALGVWLSGGLGAQSPALPWFFLQFSDPQFGAFTGNGEFSQETVNFEFVVATANRLRPAFVVVTGDLVNKPGDAAQIAEYRRIAAGLDPAIPLYNVAGNHDVENVPTPDSIAAYRALFGPDYYSFRQGSLVGIVLDSSLIHSPQEAEELAGAHERWLKAELAGARTGDARHIVVFTHHSFFLRQPDEPDEYFNIPRARRDARQGSQRMCQHAANAVSWETDERSEEESLLCTLI